MPVIQLALILLSLAPPGTPGFARIGPPAIGAPSGRVVAMRQVLVTPRVSPGCRIDGAQPPSCGSDAIAWREAVAPADDAHPQHRTVEY